jgi:hypothetical protein
MPDENGGRDTRELETRHYELAAVVDSERERRLELAKSIAELGAEVRRPRPVPWGALASAMGTVFGVIGLIGGLVLGNVSQRIEDGRTATAAVEMRFNERFSGFDERKIRRDEKRLSVDAFVEFKDAIVQRLSQLERRMDNIVTLFENNRIPIPQSPGPIHPQRYMMSPSGLTDTNWMP